MHAFLVYSIPRTQLMLLHLTTLIIPIWWRVEVTKQLVA
jgi:hypothetical protein